MTNNWKEQEINSMRKLKSASEQSQGKEKQNCYFI